jgi:hypothetical protein
VSFKAKKITAAAAALLVFSLFLSGVSASPIIPRIDYADETITLSGGTERGAVSYMYSPNVTPNLDAATKAGRKRLAAERWYPVYGNTIDISRFIPRTGSVVFAFRDADELPNAGGIYPSRRTSAAMLGRPVVSPADFRNNVRYVTSFDAPTERILVSGTLLNDGYEYKVGISSWQRGSGGFIDMSAKYNPMGGTVSVRKRATDSSFASAEFRIKIPRAPATPSLKINNSKIIGIRINDHVWSATENGTYKEFTYSTIDLNNFTSQMGVSIASLNGEMYIKVAATDKKPSSAVQRLLLPAS